ncbi:hypothetical protein [Eggerthia catenaformis]|uniref:hypothetical protein n=1 Tax=Eggerthia catenaformis TaxID=31973 RepID=UPI003C6EC72C
MSGLDRFDDEIYDFPREEDKEIGFVMGASAMYDFIFNNLENAEFKDNLDALYEDFLKKINNDPDFLSFYLDVSEFVDDFSSYLDEENELFN